MIAPENPQALPRPLVVLHRIGDGYELIVSNLPGNKICRQVKLKLRLDCDGLTPVLWQILPNEAADNLAALIELAAPEWDRAAKAEMAATRSHPAS